MKTIRAVQAVGLVVLAFMSILFMPMLERYASLHFSGWLPLAFLLLLRLVWFFSSQCFCISSMIILS